MDDLHNTLIAREYLFLRVVNRFQDKEELSGLAYRKNGEIRYRARLSLKSPDVLFV